MSFRVRGLLWSTVVLAAAEIYAQTAAPSFPNPGKTSMSKDQQTALGLEAAGQVFQQMPVLPDDSPESVYVRQLGQKLVATIPQQASWPFEFHVVPQKEINAFARAWRAAGSHEHDGVARSNEDRSVCLFRQFAGFEGNAARSYLDLAARGIDVVHGCQEVKVKGEESKARSQRSKVREN